MLQFRFGKNDDWIVVVVMLVTAVAIKKWKAKRSTPNNDGVNNAVEVVNVVIAQSTEIKMIHKSHLNIIDRNHSALQGCYTL